MTDIYAGLIILAIVICLVGFCAGVCFAVVYVVNKICKNNKSINHTLNDSMITT